MTLKESQKAVKPTQPPARRVCEPARGTKGRIRSPAPSGIRCGITTSSGIPGGIPDPAHLFAPALCRTLRATLAAFRALLSAAAQAQASPRPGSATELRERQRCSDQPRPEENPVRGSCSGCPSTIHRSIQWVFAGRPRTTEISGQCINFFNRAQWMSMERSVRWMPMDHSGRPWTIPPCGGCP
jgi:hypothetical protein